MLNSKWSSIWAIMGVLLIRSVAGGPRPCACVRMMDCLRPCGMNPSNVSPVYPETGHIQPPSGNSQVTDWERLNGNNNNAGNVVYNMNTPCNSGAAVPLPCSRPPLNWERNSQSHQKIQHRTMHKKISYSYEEKHIRLGNKPQVNQG